MKRYTQVRKETKQYNTHNNAIKKNANSKENYNFLKRNHHLYQLIFLNLNKQGAIYKTILNCLPHICIYAC